MLLYFVKSLSLNRLKFTKIFGQFKYFKYDVTFKYYFILLRFLNIEKYYFYRIHTRTSNSSTRKNCFASLKFVIFMTILTSLYQTVISKCFVNV